MNTTEKGDDLEGKIYNLLENEITQDKFWVKRESCQIYSKKAYYSKDRESDIVFDISIEVFLPGYSTYSLLILVECKNYSHPVPVSDIEEFYQKIQQVSGANVKGIVVSTNSFQEGAFTFSRSKGLGLLRYFDNSDFKWVLPRSTSTLVSSSYALREEANAYKGISNNSYKSRHFDCYCYCNGKSTNSLNSFFVHLFKSNTDDETKKQFNTIENIEHGYRRLVQFKSPTVIEQIAENALQKIEYCGDEVSVEKICEWQTEVNGLRVNVVNVPGMDGENDNMLGKITFEPLEITIFRKGNSNIRRRKFTLAHEIGHLLLGHSSYMKSEYCQEEDFDVKFLGNIGVKDIRHMEWQANQFASVPAPAWAIFYS